MYSGGIQTYRTNHILTAAIDQLMIAQKKGLSKDYEGKAKALSKAQDFITELLCSINLEQGGVIAQNLKALYHYMLTRLLQGDLARDLNAYEEVIGMLKDLKGAWESLSDVQTTESRRVATG